MCRSGGRRCRGASTSKAAAAKRARSYRARRRDAQATAAGPDTPASNQPASDQTSPQPSDQEATVPEMPADQQPAEGDVTRTSEQRVQPGKTSATGKPKQTKKPKLSKAERIMRRVDKAYKEALATQYGTPQTDEEWAASRAKSDREEARVEQIRTEITQERRERQQTTPRQEVQRERRNGPVNVVGDGNITIAHGGDVTRTKRATNRRTGRHIVEDHTSDTPASEEDRVWTVSPTPVPTSAHDRGGRDANPHNQGITQDSHGNLTITGAQGPLHITRSGRGGRPEVVGDVTADRNPRRQQPTQRQPGQQSGGQSSEKPGQATHHKARQGDVTGSRRTDDRVRQDRRTGSETGGGTGGTTNVVGDGNITIVGADPSLTTVRVTNYAAPGARVGRQAGVVTGDFVVMGGASSTPDNHTADTSDMDARMRAARDAARNKSARHTTSSHTTTTPGGPAVQTGSNNVAGQGEVVAFQVGKVADQDGQEGN